MIPQEIPNTAQPPPLEAPLPEKLDLKSLFEALLLRPHALVARLAEPNHGATGRFAIMAVVSILLFGFMGSLAIGAWVVAVAFALRFLRSVIFATGGTQKAPLTIWSIVFRLVTLQMTTSLRPGKTRRSGLHPRRPQSLHRKLNRHGHPSRSRPGSPAATCSIHRRPGRNPPNPHRRLTPGQ
jgi:hypothetical protein